MTEPDARPPRTALIADAAITLIAQQGLRALTHRAVDRAAGIPEGSTSYYAPTRQALLELAVRRLAERTFSDTGHAIARLEAITPSTSSSERAEQLAAVITALIDALAARADDMRARYALLVDLNSGDSLRGALSTDSTVQSDALDATERLLEKFGIDQARTRARQVMQLADSLTFARIASGDEDTAADTNEIMADYLRGISN
ncbi:AcrR family transcriptional regulator [Rhodococcus sp. LBL1]|nr:AcrR family transcriptional regulator [Rhodococcus sp. LBL1]MDH6683427.1 AcrR family transcriptional regulator [Rhodococcus sp. LBL2]